MSLYTKIDRATVWLLIVVLTLCAFPWHQRSSTYGVILLLVHFVFDKDLLTKIRNIRWQLPEYLGLAFFVYHFVGLLWSKYPEQGWSSIGVKMSFVLLPLMFSAEHHLTAKSFKVIMYYFLGSCALAFTYNVIYDIWHYHQLGVGVMLNRMNLTEGLMHPGYFSNYFVLALIFIGYELIAVRRRKEPRNYILLLIFLILLLLLSSKTAYLFIGLFSLFLIWILTDFIKKTLFRVLSFVGLGVFCCSIALLFPPVHNRIMETMKEKSTIPVNPQFYKSTESRMAAWSLEWELIKINPIIGYGTGSANALLIKKFEERKYDDLIKYNMHTHNQFFHTWIDIGLMGLLLLLGFVLSMAVVFIQRKHGLGFWMIVLFILNLLTDDALEIQAIGVFCLFITFLLYYMPMGKAPRRVRY